jgi:hypothetical protein
MWSAFLVSFGIVLHDSGRAKLFYQPWQLSWRNNDTAKSVSDLSILVGKELSLLPFHDQTQSEHWCSCARRRSQWFER